MFFTSFFSSLFNVVILTCFSRLSFTYSFTCLLFTSLFVSSFHISLSHLCFHFLFSHLLFSHLFFNLCFSHLFFLSFLTFFFTSLFRLSFTFLFCTFLFHISLFSNLFFTYLSCMYFTSYFIFSTFSLLFLSVEAVERCWILTSIDMPFPHELVESNLDYLANFILLGILIPETLSSDLADCVETRFVTSWAENNFKENFKCFFRQILFF
jgi:hypothetical protein